MDKKEKKSIIYTAQSKYYYFAKMMISKYVLEHDGVPLNPFNNWVYFMDDMVDRELVVRANNNLVILSNELWSFGPIADGVLEEIRFAVSLGKKIRYFSVGKKYEDIREISIDELEFENEVLQENSRFELLSELKGYS